MGLVTSAKKGGADFEPLSEGTHAAVCTWVVDTGPKAVEWQGKTKEQDKVRLRFEVPAERVTWTDGDGVEHEGPKIIMQEYTNSLSEKAKLRAHLESWRGRKFTDEELAGFDLSKLIKVPCLITVVHAESGGKTYANIQSIAGLVKGMAAPVAEGETLVFDFDSHTAQDFAKLPKWLQEIVEKGKVLRAQQEARVTAPAGHDEDNPPPMDGDDCPF